MDRTAHWVQSHAYLPNSPRNSSDSDPLARVKKHDGRSSQQSSRTDLSRQERGPAGAATGSSRRLPPSAVPGASSRSSHKKIEEPLTRSHQRSRSHSQSHSNSHSTATDCKPRLNIPTVLYRNPNLPAFVQGPPGSGYPMLMTTAQPATTHVARPVVSSSPPPQIPASLNPKVRSAV